MIDKIRPIEKNLRKNCSPEKFLGIQSYIYSNYAEIDFCSFVGELNKALVLDNDKILNEFPLNYKINIRKINFTTRPINTWI